jgi:RNA polymerase sigma factor (TIGR02999 family)
LENAFAAAGRSLFVENPGTDFAVLMRTAPGQTPPSTDVLLPLIYDELRAAAHRAMAAEAAGNTLQTTALVHEAYLRLGADPQARWENKRHYYNAAAMVMRRILVDHARARSAQKRGGEVRHVPLEEAELSAPRMPTDWLALDSAVVALEERDPDLAQLVSLRYFAGLGVEQVAAALGVSPSAVARQWRLARAFLERHIRDNELS